MIHSLLSIKRRGADMNLFTQEQLILDYWTSETLFMVLIYVVYCVDTLFFRLLTLIRILCNSLMGTFNRYSSTNSRIHPSLRDDVIGIVKQTISLLAYSQPRFAFNVFTCLNISSMIDLWYGITLCYIMHTVYRLTCNCKLSNLV